MRLFELDGRADVLRREPGARVRRAEYSGPGSYADVDRLSSAARDSAWAGGEVVGRVAVVDGGYVKGVPGGGFGPFWAVLLAVSVGLGRRGCCSRRVWGER